MDDEPWGMGCFFGCSPPTLFRFSYFILACGREVDGPCGTGECDLKWRDLLAEQQQMLDGEQQPV